MKFKAIRVASSPFRYGIVLGLAKILTPSFFNSVLIPRFYSEMRPMIRYIKTLRRTGLVGVEVGVFQGVHAAFMLSNLPLLKLFLVDPYQPYYEYGVLTNPSHAYAVAIKNLGKFKDRVTWTQASELPLDLDFVYVDGNHNYEHVKADLETYYAKVKSNGVLGGHDFTNDFPGIIKAVSEFVSEKGLDLFVEQPDWWVIKK